MSAIQLQIQLARTREITQADQIFMPFFKRDKYDQ